MKKKQLMSIMLSAVMTVSACLPSTGISALAAENAEVGSTEIAAEVTEANENTQDEPAVVVFEETPENEMGVKETTEGESAEVQSEDVGETGEIASPDSAGEEQNEAGIEESDEIASQAATEVDSASVGEPAAEVEETETADTIFKENEEEIEEETAEETVSVKSALAVDAPSDENYADAVAIAAGDSKTVTLLSDERYACFVFTPEVTANYTFYSESSSDTYGEIYNASHSKLAYDDDGGDGSNFSVQTLLQAGKTYYLAARFYYSNYSGSFTVHLEKGDTEEVDFYVEAANTNQDIYTSPNKQVSIEVSAVSSSELTYTWTDGNGERLDVNTNTYTFIPDSATSYRCDVTDGTNSAWINFRIHIDSHIEAYPEGGDKNSSRIDLPVSYGQELELKVIASADEGTNLSYTWEKDYETIENATSDSYTITSVTEKGDYSCTVSDQFGNSKTVYFYVDIETHLNAYPAGGEVDDDSIDIEAAPNSELTLKVIASADEGVQLTYTWEKDYETIENANADTYTIASVTDEGDYSCTVSDQFGNSKTVYFYVSVETHLKAYPAGGDEDDYRIDLDVTVNSELTLKVIASADEGTELTYRWAKDYSTIENANSDSYTIASVTESADYSCTVSDQFGNSKTVYFYVGVETHLTAYPEGSEGGSSIRFDLSPYTEKELRVIASADEGVELTYSWQKNYSTIEGAVSDSYKIESVTGTATYCCIVRDSYGNSEYIYFYINVVTHLKAYPEGERETFSSTTLYLAPHSSKTLRVIASADEGVELTYSWQKDYSTITGATSDSFTIDDVSSRGYYICTVRDSFGNSKLVYFSVYVENHFKVFADGGGSQYTTETTLFVPYNGSDTLLVLASADDSSQITYTWSDDNGTISGATDRYLNISNVTKTCYYRCNVSDQYGNSVTCRFHVVINNELTAYPEGASRRSDYIFIKAAPESRLQLHTIASAGDTSQLTYTWYEDYDERIDGENTPYYVIDPVTDSESIRCVVKDQYNNEAEVEFQIAVDNKLELRQKENLGVYNATHTVYTVKGGEVELKLESVNALKDQEGLKLQWYRSGRKINGATSDSYTAVVNENEQFFCTVTDGYGDSAYSYYNVRIDAPFSAYVDGYNNGKTSLDIDRSTAIGKELKVAVVSPVADTVRYDWYITDQNERRTIEGSDSPVYVIKAEDVQKPYTNIYCDVEDIYGNHQRISFYIEDYADIYPEGAERYSSGEHSKSVSMNADPSQDKVTLNVIAEGDTVGNLTYMWRDENTGESIEADSARIVVDLDKYIYYSCTVSDPIGERGTVYFVVNNTWIHVAADQNGYFDTTVAVAEGETCVLRPIVTGRYEGVLSYMWFKDDRILLEETGPSLTVAPEKHSEYSCIVSTADGASDYAIYDVNIGTLTVNSATAGAKRLYGNTFTLDLVPGTNVELKNTVTSTLSSSFTYMWYRDNMFVSSNASLPITTDEESEYYCIVRDEFGNESAIFYDVDINHFGASAVQRTVRYNPETDSTCRLQASVNADDKSGITYTWYERYYDTPIAERTLNYIDVNPAASQNYYCTVEDPYGNSIRLTFSVAVEAGLTAKPVGWQTGNYDSDNNRLTILTTQGANLTLSTEATVNGSSSIAYKWRRHDLDTASSSGDGWVEIENNSASLNITFDKDTRYVCAVQDRYGNVKNVIFDVAKGVKVVSSDITASSAVYNGKEQHPITIAHGGVTLVEGTDYVIKYNTKPVNAGTYTATITFKGKYSITGEMKKDFSISQAAQQFTAAAGVSSIAVGKATKITVTGAEGELSFASKDGTIASVDSSTGKVTGKKVGTVGITVTAKATTNYKATSKTVTIKVVPAATTSLTAANLAKGIKITWKKVAGANGYIIYRNNTKIKTITSGATVTYSDAAANTNGTKYTYKVVAKATTGTSTLSKSLVTYRVARPTISSITNVATRKMTLKWAKNAKGSGYQIQYGLKSSFSGAITVTAAKNTIVTKTIGSLTKGKTYYVRLRTYKTVSGKKYYSTWSATKKLVIKK